MVIDDYTPGGDEPSRQDSMSSNGLASGIVVSSRIRLARNIAHFPFLMACSDAQRAEIETTVRAGLERCDPLSDLKVFDAEQLELLERQFLTELQSVVALAKNKTAVLEAKTGNREEPSLTEPAIQDDELSQATDLLGFSLTLNEEDHLRIQVTRPGFDLENAWEEANRLDDLIENYLNYAYDPRWGYLTACPANVGTGLRVSVVLHLPALVMTGEIDSVLRGLNRTEIAGRELIGNLAGSDFFRICNQTTLGRDETELVRQVASAVPTIVQAERAARESMLDENHLEIEQEVAFALTELLRADLNDDSEQNRRESTRLLSRVRMGIGMGLLSRADADRVSQKFELIQLRRQLTVAVSHEDFHRASQLRDRIQFLEGGSP